MLRAGSDETAYTVYCIGSAAAFPLIQDIVVLRLGHGEARLTESQANGIEPNRPGTHARTYTQPYAQ